MSRKLNSSLFIQKLALDLGVGSAKDPVGSIIRLCEKQIRDFMQSFQDCENLSAMLDWVASKVGTSFVRIDNDSDLQKVRDHYLSKGEKRFVGLADFLAAGDDFGVTFRLGQREAWELEFVSIIDYRGNKAAHAYFTKWHEIAHLLTQTQQMRFSFRRTHSSDQNPDEERLMDIIASKFGFFPQMVHKAIDSEISFEAVSRLRSQLCPEASYQASLISFARFWPTPVILIRAEMAYKKAERQKLNQLNFGFEQGPKPSLRAIHVTCSESASESGFAIFPNMRVPERSIVHAVLSDENYSESEEDLSWWESSDGWRPSPTPVRIMARYSWGGVDVLIVPKP